MTNKECLDQFKVGDDDPRWHSGDMNDPQVRARDPLTRRFDAAHERRIEMALERLRLPQINRGAVTGRWTWRREHD